MIHFDQIKTNNLSGEGARKDYFDGILKLIDKKAEEKRRERDTFIDPEKLLADREGYRKKFVDMLGWPLTEYKNDTLPNVKKELLEELDFLTIYRLRIETLPDLWFEGVLFVPAEREERAPLVIVNPGGTYCSEDLIAHGTYECGQYKNIGGRALERGAIIFAPQFLLWTDPSKYYDHAMRPFFDAKLKAMGGSITALEIYNTRRALDYILATEPVDETRIGMMGLSYGGFYALYISAVETRIRSVFSSCFFCDRFSSDRQPSGCRSDWLWQNSADSFFDAEIAALIAPRGLYIENGDTDPLFPVELTISEQKRLLPYYAAASAEDKLKLYIGHNGHEVSVGDEGFEFFMKNLLDKD